MPGERIIALRRNVLENAELTSKQFMKSNQHFMKTERVFSKNILNPFNTKIHSFNVIKLMILPLTIGRSSSKIRSEWLDYLTYFLIWVCEVF